MLIDPFQPDRFRRSLERSQGRRAAAERSRTRRRWRVALPSTGLSLLLAATLVAGTFAQLAVGAGSGGATAAHAAPVLKLGSRGPAVVELQRKLRISADGVFGPMTERAVKRFQRRRGLTVDGVVGPRTRRALRLRSTAVTQPRRRLTMSQILAKIAQCESGGNPRAVSRDGRYRGKYQFAWATWRNLGGKGDPARAPEAEQDRLAEKLYRQTGGSAWPNCAPR